MTIEVNYNPIRQQGNGITTQFSYDFYALSDQYLVVYIEEDGVQTVTTDYTATVSETGGIVTFNVAPTKNQYVVITRSTTISQEVPYTTSRGFDAKVVESSFDKDIAISQELQNQLTRTPKVPEGYNYNIQLPNPDDGKALVWNGSEGKIRNSNFTLEESMSRAAASAELSKDWAEKTTGLVNGDYSSKAYAIGGTGTETNNAKYYATQASNSADVAYAAATNENVVAVGTDLITDNNIGAVAGNATNINNVASNATNINLVATNASDVNIVATNIADVTTNATNISAINTAANNIVDIQNASANAQLARDWAIKMNGLVSSEDYSAKYWAGKAEEWAESVGNPANKDLSNLNPQGQNITNWSTNVTNCITEIPQDIKLELNAGTLTLKAGSKVYVPNGAGVFDEVIIANDLTQTGFPYSGDFFIAIKEDNSFGFTRTSDAYSGSTQGSDGWWYDTTNNIIKDIVSGSWTGSYKSFPVCVFTSDGTNITSIKQIFNGFGYIGSTVFALPGVKGLIPNGRNADGTLKSTEFETNNVITFTAGNYSLPVTICIDSSSMFTNGAYLYNEKENFNYNGTARGSYSSCAECNLVGGVISNWNQKTPFHAVDYNDYKAGAEIITGLKTVNVNDLSESSLNIQNDDAKEGVTPANTIRRNISFTDKNGVIQGVIGETFFSGGSRSITITPYENGISTGQSLLIGVNGLGNIYTEAPSCKDAGSIVITSQINDTGDFGYIVFGNGLKIQWGLHGPVNASTFNGMTFNYSIPFVNNVPFVNVSFTAVANGFIARVSNTTNTTYTVQSDQFDGSKDPLTHLRWIAIGF